jgi:acetyl-CoA/propionyl-CoA carboxylase biotin carboxyl carrier protein
VDTGIESGSVIGGNFDSLLAKLIVTGSSREEALARSRRALDEMVVEGMATALPFHRAVVIDEAFTADPFTVHTRWIETEFDNTIPPYAGAAEAPEDTEPREVVVVEVGGRRLEVSLPGGLTARSGGVGGGGKAAPKRRAAAKAGAAAGGDAVVAPMQGTIVKIAVENGQEVAAGDLLLVLEAMKMENPVTAPKAGIVGELTAEPGSTVTSGTVLLQITDAS